MRVGFRRNCSVWKTSGILAWLACLLIATPAWSQSTAQTFIDTQPPVIELDELANGVADSSQVFTVQVNEETALQEVTLFYRRAGQQGYTSALMTPLGSLGLYSTSIPTDPTDLSTIEYYFQASDTSGNRALSGFAFDPYSRTLAQSPRVQSPADTLEKPDMQQSPAISAQATPFYKKRWFQVTLGIVAVSVLASTLDTDGEDTRIVPVTLTAE